MDPEYLIPITFFLTTAFVIVAFPLARAKARSLDRGAAQLKVPLELSQRLERIEQAIDSIAVEVERISEGQRFTTKLLSERANAQVLPPGGNPTS